MEPVPDCVVVGGESEQSLAVEGRTCKAKIGCRDWVRDLRALTPWQGWNEVY